MAPQTNGAHTFYASVLAPYLRTHEKEIKAFIEKVQSQADEVGKEAMKQAKAAAKEHATPENMMRQLAWPTRHKPSSMRPPQRTRKTDK